MVPGLLMLGVDAVEVEVVAVCAPAIISGVRCYRESGKIKLLVGVSGSPVY